MNYDDNYTTLRIPSEKDLSVVVENAPLKPSEQQEINEMINKYGIDVYFLEYRAIVNSFFDSISVFLNPDITNLLISGFVTPAVYDALKECLHYMVMKISSRKHLKEENESGVAFRLKIKNADIYAPIPSGLSDAQFSAYMDMIKSSFMIVNKEQEETNPDYQRLFLMYESGTEEVKIKTVQDYAKTQMEKKKDKTKKTKQIK